MCGEGADIDDESDAAAAAAVAASDSGGDIVSALRSVDAWRESLTYKRK